MQSGLPRLIVAATAVLSGSAALTAADGPSAAERELERLVHRLGSADFAEREQAQRELLDLGPAALPALRRTATADDLELRYRALQILAELQSRLLEQTLAQLESGDPAAAVELLPGWKRYSRLVGSSPEARRLFVDMVRTEPALMQAADGAPEQISAEFEHRCADLSLRRVQRRRDGLPVPSVAALLFIGSLEEFSPSVTAATCVQNVVLTDGDFASEMNRPDRPESVRQLIALWVIRPDGAAASQRLSIAIKFELPEGMEVSREIIASGQNGIPIQQAILFIARFGSRENIAELEELLADETELPTQRRGSTNMFSARVQDVALAGLLHLTEQEPKEYGFESIRANPQYLYNPGTMGFTSDEARQRALERWHAWRAEHFKDMLPFVPDAVEGVAT
jgi:hypothetical protein